MDTWIAGGDDVCGARAGPKGRVGTVAVPGLRRRRTRGKLDAPHAVGTRISGQVDALPAYRRGVRCCWRPGSAWWPAISTWAESS